MAEYEKQIISLAQQLPGQPRSKSEMSSAQSNAFPRASDSEVEARPENSDAPKSKETKDGSRTGSDDRGRSFEASAVSPGGGFVVTVYGATRWRAMLTITPAAGAVRNPQEWRDLAEELAERLRKRYDLAGG